MSPNQPSSWGRRQESTSTPNTKSTGPYDRNFQWKLIEGGAYPDGYVYPDGRVPPQPDNWEEINQRLAQPRPSLSVSQFSDGMFREFKRADAHAFKEKQVTTSVTSTIQGETRDAGCVSGGIPFKNLDPLADGTLVLGNPDLYYGARPEQLDRRVRMELSGRIIPSTQVDLPMVPNFFLAAKGPDGSAAVAKRQLTYDGVLGARGVNSLQSYGQDEPVYDNHAYTITSSYHDGQLKMYTTHPTRPTNPGGRPEYFLNQLRSFAMTDTADTFRQGAAAFRNLRDWTKEQRDKAIARANEKVNNSRGRAPDASGSSLTTGFTSEASPKSHDIDLPAQESRTSLNENFNTAPTRESPRKSDTAPANLAAPDAAKGPASHPLRRSSSVTDEIAQSDELSERNSS